MRQPPERPGLPPRRSENTKRRLLKAPSNTLITNMSNSVTYKGSPKHKRHPHRYGLPPFSGPRGDATLCDDHANFSPPQMSGIPAMIRRGLRAGLIGRGNRIIWAVADDGWIFEGRLTNVATNEYHGYPVRPSEAIAELVYRRFSAWAKNHGTIQDQLAAKACKNRYGFR